MIRRERTPSTSFWATLQGVAPKMSVSTSTCERGVRLKLRQRDARGGQGFVGRQVGLHVERDDRLLAVGKDMQRALPQRVGQRRVGDDEDAVHVGRRTVCQLCGGIREGVEIRQHSSIPPTARLFRAFVALTGCESLEERRQRVGR